MLWLIYNEKKIIHTYTVYNVVHYNNSYYAFV